LTVEEAKSLLSSLTRAPDYKGQVEHIEVLPPREARFAEPHPPLPKALREALKRIGIERLYKHQVEALDLLRKGKNIMVVASAAGGKTLCYNLAIFEALINDPKTRALYLFPTKALAQDQLRKIREFSPGIDFVRPATYDGDTPSQDRAAIRRLCNLVLSNPDMLHVGILPNHTQWAHFFSSLKFVVLDEAHVYKGIFGAHTANVIRRLRRICEHYGSRPQFVLCTATIGNPKELARKLVGEEVEVVSNDASPTGAKFFVLWNPPIIDLAGSRRRSPNYEATSILAHLIRHGVRTIAFAKARKVAELILRYARDMLKDNPALAERLASYRAGYLPEERRDIERRLFKGELLGVSSTSALELGIDIGDLDACIIVGYPRSKTSLWQQAGRAGRRLGASLAFLVAYEDPLDQYFMRHPESLFKGEFDEVILDPDNRYILGAHLLCAAHELPFQNDGRFFPKERAESVLKRLEAKGLLRKRGEKWYWTGPGTPAPHFGLRSASSSGYQIVDITKGKVIATVDEARAFETVHPGAIYLHQGETYLVEELDIKAKVARVVPADVDYYTEPRIVKDTRIIEELRSKEVENCEAYFGRLRVTEKVIGYRRRQHYTEAILSYHDLDLPERKYDTQGLWLIVPPRVAHEVAELGLHLMGGIHAMEHAMIGLLPLFAACDREDVGGISNPFHPDTAMPTVFIYDAYLGGVGIAERGFERLKEWMEATLEQVSNCPCEEGCPSCIQSPKCGSNNEPLDKSACSFILARLLGRGRKEALDLAERPKRKRQIASAG